MTAIAAHWDPATRELVVANCGHVVPAILRGDGSVERVDVPRGRGLGGRATPQPAERTSELGPGDRLVLVSDGVVECREGTAGLGLDGVIEAALSSERETAADTVREIHRAVLAATDGDLSDDATAVCLSVE
jgi:serine phosphatase RsbU (regulator of sigma subunit)